MLGGRASPPRGPPPLRGDGTTVRGPAVPPRRARHSEEGGPARDRGDDPDGTTAVQTVASPAAASSSRRGAFAGTSAGPPAAQRRVGRKGRASFHVKRDLWVSGL